MSLMVSGSAGVLTGLEPDTGGGHVQEDSGLVGAVVVDGSGEVVGRAAAMLVDPAALEARWLLVTLPDGTEAVVPMQVASVDATGWLVVPYGAGTVAGAPKVNGRIVTRQDADDLLRYYGFVT